MHATTTRAHGAAGRKQTASWTRCGADQGVARISSSSGYGVSLHRRKIITAARGARQRQETRPTCPTTSRSWFKGRAQPEWRAFCNYRGNGPARPGRKPSGRPALLGLPIAGEWRPVPPEVVVLKRWQRWARVVVWYVQAGREGTTSAVLCRGGGGWGSVGGWSRRPFRPSWSMASEMLRDVHWDHWIGQGEWVGKWQCGIVELR